MNQDSLPAPLVPPCRVLILGDQQKTTSKIEALLSEVPSKLYLYDTFPLSHPLSELSQLPYDAVLFHISTKDQITRFAWRIASNVLGSLPLILITPEHLLSIAEQHLEFGAVDCLSESSLSFPLLERSIKLAQVTMAPLHLPIATLLKGAMTSLTDTITVIDEAYRVVINNKESLAGDEQKLLPFPYCYQLQGRSEPCKWCRLKEVFRTGHKAISKAQDIKTGQTWELTFSPIKNTKSRLSLVAVQKRDITHIVAAEDALKESEFRHKTLMDNIPNGIVLMFDHGLRNILVAGEMLANISITPNMLQGKRLRDVAPSEQANTLENFFRKALRGERNWFVIEFRGRYFDIHTIPLKANQGAIVYGMAMAQDVTDQRLASIELTASHEKFRAIFENSRDGICVYELAQDNTARIIDCNKAYVEQANHTHDALVNCTDIRDLQVISPEIRRHYAEHISRGIPYSGTFSWKRTDKQFNIMEFQAVPVSEGTQRLIYEISRDMTDRILAEEALKNERKTLETLVEERTTRLQLALNETNVARTRAELSKERAEESRIKAEEAKERLDVILKSVAEGIVVTDPQGHIVMMNSYAEALFGIKQHLAYGQPILKQIKEYGGTSALYQAIRSGEFTGDPFYFEIRTNGTIRHIRTRLSPILDIAGQQGGMVASMDDVTKEREVDRLKDEFISTAAHELRIPLTTIQGFSELMVNRESLERKDIHHYSDLIHKSSVSLSKIVTDLLDISRIESGESFSIAKKETSLAAIIQQVFNTFTENYRTHIFHLTLPPAIQCLPIDADKITQVISNLLSNAVKYSPPATNIWLTLSHSTECCTISIADQGVGMTQEQCNRIFERFYRGHAAEGTIQGTGLGMSIAKYIVEEHGGNIWVDSAQGKGTTVSFTLPLYCQLSEKIE